MERKWISVLVCFAASAFLSAASAITLSNDSTIQPGANHAEVEIVGESTTVEMIGGQIGQVIVANSSIINISDGEIRGTLSVRHFATANIRGGSIAEIFAIESSVINIHAYGVIYDETGGEWGHGKITGKWFDDTPFETSLYNSDHYGNDTYEHLKFLPEPATLILLGVGFTFVRSRRCGRKS